MALPLEVAALVVTVRPMAVAMELLQLLLLMGEELLQPPMEEKSQPRRADVVALSGIALCDSDTDSNRAPRTVCETSKTKNLGKQRPFFYPLLLVGS